MRDPPWARECVDSETAVFERTSRDAVHSAPADRIER
jgi:hypothetical protein